MKDGMIKLDSDFAKDIGFTSNLFDGWLWKTGQRITISFIESKIEGKGNLSKLFNNIESLGYKVAVPTPFRRMQSILEKKGFVPHIEECKEMGDCVEIWEKPE